MASLPNVIAMGISLLPARSYRRVVALAKDLKLKPLDYYVPVYDRL